MVYILLRVNLTLIKTNQRNKWEHFCATKYLLHPSTPPPLPALSNMSEWDSMTQLQERSEASGSSLLWQNVTLICLMVVIRGFCYNVGLWTEKKP